MKISGRLKVAALTSGVDIPSRRFRVHQFIPDLAKLAVDVEEYCPLISQHARLPGKLSNIRMRYLPPVLAGQMLFNSALRIPGILGSYSADVVWLERSFIPGLEVLAKSLKRPVVLDVDDAVWLMNPLGERSARFLTGCVDAVVAGNSYLANWYSSYCRNIYILPTAIDCRRYSPGRPPELFDGGEFVVGWIGTSSNFAQLRSAEKGIADFLGMHPEARFLVVADKPPDLREVPPGQICFEPWSAQTEVAAIQKMDVGIMPLIDNDWTRGKCSFKMLQYMATGIPVAVSNVGNNKDVLSKGQCGIGIEPGGDWSAALEYLFKDPPLRRRMGQEGRSIVETYYSVTIAAENLAKVFREIT